MKTIGEQAVAEFVGTLALVFIGAGSVVIAIANGGGYVGLIGVALAHGLVLATFISNLGHVSGGHYNPAVTIAVWVGGKIETLRAGVYVLAQLAGAAAGAGLLRWVVPERAWRNAFLGATLVSHRFLVGGQLTGASMNPARSFGPALVGGKWTDFWVYIIGPVSGGIIAAALYVVVFLRAREVAAPRTETPIGGGPEEET